MPSTKKCGIFKTSQRIRLGIWGLGRGMSFYKTCSALNMDVVAGCDFNAHMRERFMRENPGAWATEDASKFLAGDFDAVLLATFCPAHADDAIACLKAGKHVLSEVTAFHTMAEGVRLVEAVERSDRVYNMVENYPFSAPNMYLQRKWKEGLFGELMYAEYEYVHEIRELLYSYIDGTPLNPGDSVHNWRSWLNFHYYNTHSLGPIMYVTGTRPTRIVALPGEQRLAGFLMHPRDGMGGVTPSLITMSNGGLVRNLMGATASDTHVQRLWGTRGAAEQVDGKLRLRLGGGGHSPKHEVIPAWDELGEHAAKTGHSGGDFWVLYFFARQILEGTPAPFDIYTAADCTIPGILAWRSQNENGKPYDVPNFRNKAERKAWRGDEIQQPRYDTKQGLFPKGADRSITTQFSATMIELIGLARNCRAYLDWHRIEREMASPGGLIEIVNRVIADHSRRREIFPRAHRIADAYPSSDGARVLREMLELAEDRQTGAPAFLKRLKQELAGLRRRYPSASSPV